MYCANHIFRLGSVCRYCCANNIPLPQGSRLSSHAVNRIINSARQRQRSTCANFFISTQLIDGLAANTWAFTTCAWYVTMHSVHKPHVWAQHNKTLTHTHRNVQMNRITQPCVVKAVVSRRACLCCVVCLLINSPSHSSSTVLNRASPICLTLWLKTGGARSRGLRRNERRTFFTHSEKNKTYTRTTNKQTSA